jgi:iron-sulfur cluster assembly accessory protein
MKLNFSTGICIGLFALSFQWFILGGGGLGSQRKILFIVLVSQKMIRVSPVALSHMFKKSRNMFFYVKSGGCNGFEYVLEPCDTAPKNSELHQEPDGALHICNMSTLYLLGTEIDWKEDIMGSRFVFSNPNARSKCGCGSTFSV